MHWLSEDLTPSKSSRLSLQDFITKFGSWVEGTFIWSPPRGGNLNSQPAHAGEAATTSKRDLKGLGIADTDVQQAQSLGPRTTRGRGQWKQEEAGEPAVAGLYTPEGSRKPSSLHKEHFEKKKQKLKPPQRASSLSSISTPGSLSPLFLESLAPTPEPAQTPETVAEGETQEREKVEVEEDDNDSEKEVEQSVADPSSPKQELWSPTPSEADKTFVRQPEDEEEAEIEQEEREEMAAERPWGPPPPLGHPTAPAYDGDQSQLHAYLRDFESWKDGGLTDAKTVQLCVKYVRSTQIRKIFELTEKRWKQQEAAKQTWAEFRASILARFPDAYDDSRAYTIESLEHHIEGAPPSAFQSATEFQEFFNTFEVIAEELLSSELMTQAGINVKLCNAIPQSEVKRTTLQKDYLGMEASAVDWRQFGERYRKMLATGSTAQPAREDSPARAVKSEPAVKVKAEPTETAAMMAAITALSTQVQALVEGQKLPQQQPYRASQPMPWERPQQYPRATPGWGNKPTDPWQTFDRDCAYCGKIGHLMMQCDLYNHDQAANGVFYSMRARLLKVYGREVAVATGATPAAAAAEYRGPRFIPMPGPAPPAEPPAPAPTSTNMMSVVGAVKAKEAVSTGLSHTEPRIVEWKSDEEEEVLLEEESDEEADDDEATLANIVETMAQFQKKAELVAQKLAQKKGEKKKLIPEVVLPRRSKASIQRASEKGIEARERKAEEAAEELARGPPKSDRKAAQYHLEAPTDNPEAQARVLEACKDGCVPMTFGDLLAVSDPLRAKVHMETRRRRVPNSGAAEEEKEEIRMSSVREAAVNELWGMVLAMPVTPVLSKLMAASDFVRNNMHADTNRKAQLAIEHSTPTMAFLTTPTAIRADSPRVAIAAKETHLWAINAFIADYHEKQEFQLTDVVIDDGSGICAIREDVAEQLNFPYEHAPILCQQFDGTCVEHGDLIRNLPVTVGSVRVYIQAYVLPNIGPQMILGGPFEAVVRLRKETMDEARPMYHLLDPAKKVEINVLGHVRKAEKKGF